MNSGGLPGHGGDLRAALAAAGVADMSGWHDLSTGINPYAYPLPDLAQEDWARLPGAIELTALNDAARACYGASAGTRIVAAAGTELLINLLPSLFPPGRVNVLGPTYASHAHAWRRAGHEIREIATMDEADGGVVVLTNPNNPDGRVIALEALRKIADDLTARGGWLIVDEAFADTMPQVSALPLIARSNAIVLRSFGKFFGLAGVRLGFAAAPREMAALLAERLGDWPVSGAALAIGIRALADAAWQDGMRALLLRDAEALDALLERAGITVAGGTPLFRLIDDPRAPALYEALWRNRIYARRFERNAHWLRLGLPAPDALDALTQTLEDVAGERQ